MQEGDLRYYYQNELNYIRGFIKHFSKIHPDIAGHLNKDKNNIDPFTEQLIEAIGLLKARMHLKLDAEFSETCAALLNIIAPPTQLPLPSTAIIQFNAKNYNEIPKNTLLTAFTPLQEACYFSTGYSLSCFPLEVSHVELTSVGMSEYKSALSITLSPLLPFDLSNKKLSFFINLHANYAYMLYELIFSHTQKIILNLEENNIIHLDKNHLQAEGLDAEQSLFPYDPRENAASNLLTEFFHFSQKFLFFSLTELDIQLTQKPLKITFLFDFSNIVLNNVITHESLKLNCIPIINIFPEISEPLHLTHTQTEYLLQTRLNHPPHTAGIYTIQEVYARNAKKEVVPFYPPYGIKYDAAYTHHYYQTIRRQSHVYIQFSTKTPELFYAYDWTVTAKMLCTNQKLSTELPYGGNSLKIDFVHPENHPSVTAIRLLTPFTEAKDNRLIENNLIKTLIHYLLMQQSPYSLLNLKPLIPPQFFAAMINLSSHFAETPLPLKQIASASITGINIVLQVDTEKAPQSQLFFLGCILDRYFSLQAGINTYTRLIMIDKQGKEVHRWPPRWALLNK